MSNDLHAVIRHARTDFDAYVETTVRTLEDGGSANLVGVVARLVSDVQVLYSLLDALTSIEGGVDSPDVPTP